MTNEHKQPENTEQSKKGNRPDYVVKVRHGSGKDATWERIGAGWKNDNGSLYVKFIGTQLVSSFTIFPVNKKEKAEV